MIETLSRVDVQERLTRPSLVQEPAAPCGLGVVLIRAAIVTPLLALALLLIASGLAPALFVAIVAFLPALAPIILVGLGILATAGVKAPAGDRICDPHQPCCCGRHEHAAGLGFPVDPVER